MSFNTPSNDRCNVAAPIANGVAVLTTRRSLASSSAQVASTWSSPTVTCPALMVSSAALSTSVLVTSVTVRSIATDPLKVAEARSGSSTSEYRLGTTVRGRR